MSELNSSDKNKISIRPKIAKAVVNENMMPDEKFQNESLRPILKMQHELLIVLIKEFIILKKNAYYELSNEKKPDYIKNNLLADKRILHELRGLVLGLFTLEEMEYYLNNKSSINKRIQSLLFQRISSFL